MAIVYRHRRLDNNEIFYIGIGKTEKRAYQKTQRNRFWNFIINKTDYEIDIVAKDLSIDEAKELEIFLIAEYGRKDIGTGNLTNLSEGGEGAYGCKRTEYFKLNISKKMIGNKNSFGIKHSNEINKSKGRSGQLNAMFGKSPMLGKSHSNKAKLKMSISKIGKKNMTSDGRKRLSESRKNKGKICIDLETGIFYDTIKQLSIAKGICYEKLKFQLRNDNIKNLKLI